MTQDEIIRMAREGKSVVEQVHAYVSRNDTDFTSESMAKMVCDFIAAHEREKQAKQEPVAWMWNPSKPFPQYTVITDNKEHLEAAKEQGVEITKLYAAPVRTKDLTDDEIDKLIEEACESQMPYDMFARAVIAADREKNK